MPPSAGGGRPTDFRWIALAAAIVLAGLLSIFFLGRDGTATATAGLPPIEPAIPPKQLNRTPEKDRKLFGTGGGPGGRRSGGQVRLGGVTVSDPPPKRTEDEAASTGDAVRERD